MFAPPLAARRRARKAGPATIRVGRGHRAIGNGIAESYDGGCIRGRGDIDVGQEVERLRCGCVRHGGCGGGVAFLGNIGSVQPDGVHGVRGGAGRYVNAHGQIALSGNIQIHGIANFGGAGRNPAGRTAAEQQRAIGCGNDGGIHVALRDVRRADYERRAAEDIRQLDAHALAADAGMRDHAQRLIVEAGDRRRPGGAGPAGLAW